jgi:hypothetical protein
MPRLFPEAEFRDYEIPRLEDVNHYTSWVDACLDSGATTSNFAYAGRLTETVLLGAVAIRFPGERLQWDAQAGQISGPHEATAYLTKSYRRGW